MGFFLAPSFLASFPAGRKHTADQVGHLTAAWGHLAPRANIWGKGAIRPFLEQSQDQEAESHYTNLGASLCMVVSISFAKVEKLRPREDDDIAKDHTAGSGRGET